MDPLTQALLIVNTALTIADKLLTALPPDKQAEVAVHLFEVLKGNHEALMKILDLLKIKLPLQEVR